MTTCAPTVVDLCRACRLHISWPVTGVDGTTQALASLEGGAWIPLNVAADFKTVIGYFAGPDYAVPGAAAVVTRTSYVTVRIITGTEQLDFPGGFVRLIP